MNMNRYRFVLGWTSAVLVLAACGSTPAPASTVTPLPSLSPATATREPGQPATSTPAPAPTGTALPIGQEWRVAYFAQDPMRICVVDADGSDLPCLDLKYETFPADYQAPGFLALSPDGAKVAYGTECTIYIWTIGGEVFPLRTGEPCGNFREVDWAPDSNSIVYISEELFRTCQTVPCQSFFGDIFISRIDGSIHRPLTGDLDGWSHSPDWSPDGKDIVFSLGAVSEMSESGYTVNEDIAVIPAEGGDMTRLTFDAGVDARPQWSPDGRMIAFLSERDGAGLMNLYLIHPDGAALRLAAELESPNHWPYSSASFFWLPDGVHILHDDRLIDTSTGQSEPVRLPFRSRAMQASWVTSPQAAAISFVPNSSDCTGDWSRLRPDMYAVVAGGQDGDPNRVRAAPDGTAKIVSQIYPGTLIRVVEGPVCANGLVFWKVEHESIPGGAGWTAEGDLQEYFLEPSQ